MKYASNPSVAGGLASQELAKWTRDKFLEFGLKNASLETYYPYLNYPKKRALTIVNGEEIIYEASLLESDGTIPTYHGKAL
jgi:N-acetylated-alpha-linked acidic dipeptidase